MELERSNVQLNARVANKAEAIQAAGGLLVSSQYMKPGYIDSMLAREKVANTFLGNGIAIPHGLPKDRDLINQTGIAVLQVPGGVQWNRGETVNLVVAIAARSDEHIGILANLTNVLNDEETVRKLATTENPDDIIQALSGKPPDRPAPAEALADFPTSIDVIIHNPTGLHARPAAVFASLAKEYASDVRVRFGEKAVNGKSLASLLTLGVEGGSVVRVMAQGPTKPRPSKRSKQRSRAGWAKRKKPPPRKRYPPMSGKRNPARRSCPVSQPRPGWPSARCASSSEASLW